MGVENGDDDVGKDITITIVIIITIIIIILLSEQALKVAWGYTMAMMMLPRYSVPRA